MKTIIYLRRAIFALSLLAVLHAFAEESRAPAATPSTNLAPTIKGLSIGMDFSELPSWFAAKLKDTTLAFEILPQGSAKVFLMAPSIFLQHLQESSGSVKMDAEGRETQLRVVHEEIPSLIMATADGKVAAILLRPNLVNYLFHASDLTADEFVQTFAEAYQLNNMKPDDSLTSRTCTTAKGVKITIDADKTVSIKRVAAPAEVKGAFD